MDFPSTAYVIKTTADFLCLVKEMCLLWAGIVYKSNMGDLVWFWTLLAFYYPNVVLSSTTGQHMLADGRGATPKLMVVKKKNNNQTVVTLPGTHLHLWFGLLRIQVCVFFF